MWGWGRGEEVVSFQRMTTRKFCVTAREGEQSIEQHLGWTDPSFTVLEDRLRGVWGSPSIMAK